MIKLLKKIIPKWFIKLYHYKMAIISAIIYGFPSRKIKVIGVTGTKGKSTVTEIVNAILEEAGFKVALSNTIRFKIADKEKRNLYKMTMPGRFFIQKFLRQAIRDNCKYAVVEMTSEGVKQYRHKFIELDALVVTNISPEHIESHGSFEKYLEAKLELAKSLSNSKKGGKVIITNIDDENSPKFITAAKNCESFPFSKKDAEPYEIKNEGLSLTFRGEKIESPLRGLFNIENILASATLATALGISPKTTASAINKFQGVRGRVEFIRHSSLNIPFEIVVDYAHTIDSLTKLYEAFPNQRKICVLGNTGGGRDKWKRKGMAEIADKYCDQIILTNEDPYDEDPMEILNQMKVGIKNKPFEIILDRREAIKSAINKALFITRAPLVINRNEKIVVLISGKGTDPYIMGPRGSKVPWDDAEAVREELEKILSTSNK